MELKFFKKVLAACLCSVLLSVTVGSAGFRGYEVKAGSVVDVVGGGALFDFLLGLFGVSCVLGDNTPSGMPLYNEYIEYLASGGSSMTYEDYEALASGNVVTISQGLVDSVKAFLEEKVGNLSSGSVVGLGNFLVDRFTSLGAFQSNAVSFLSSKYDYFFVCSVPSTVSNFRVWSEFPDCVSGTYAVICPYSSSMVTLRFVTYDSFGFPVGSSLFSSSSLMMYSNGWSLGSESVLGYTSKSGFTSISSFPFFLSSPVPVIVTDTVNYSKLSSMSLSSLLSSAFYVSDGVSSRSIVSFGGYSTDTVNRLIGKTVSASTVSSANRAVADAITSNTLTDAETGAVSYTDEIAQAVADAVAKALADAGAVDRPSTGEGEGEGEGEEGEKPLPVVPDILDFLKGMKDSIVQGFQDVGEWIMDIPQSLENFFTSLWDWLQRIWEAICALPGQIAEAFQSMLGSGDPPGEGESGDSDTSGFLADLSTLFPFCIPFDLIRLFKVMQSTARAPYWEVPLDVPSIGFHYVFVIDFAQFETLAQIFRVCETIGFICGLLLVTRKLIRG